MDLSTWLVMLGSASTCVFITYFLGDRIFDFVEEMFGRLNEWAQRVGKRKPAPVEFDARAWLRKEREREMLEWDLAFISLIRAYGLLEPYTEEMETETVELYSMEHGVEHMNFVKGNTYVAAVQNVARKSGFYSGPADGIMGPATIEAMHRLGYPVPRRPWEYHIES